MTAHPDHPPLTPSTQADIPERTRTMTNVLSAFEAYRHRAYPHSYAAEIHVTNMAGGTPSDPNVAEGWLKTKLTDKDDLIRDLVMETMVERGVTEDEAILIVDQTKNLNGFRRDPARGGELYYEGRCLKAALKEAVSVAVNAGKMSGLRIWGDTDNKTYLKQPKAWFPEHVFVREDRLYLGVKEPTGVVQRFVHTTRGAAIQYEEYVEDVSFEFTIDSDYDFPEDVWAMIWLTGQQQGVGASRSQGFGRYVVTKWDRL